MPVARDCKMYTKKKIGMLALFYYILLFYPIKKHICSGSHFYHFYGVSCFRCLKLEKYNFTIIKDIKEKIHMSRTRIQMYIKYDKNVF